VIGGGGGLGRCGVGGFEGRDEGFRILRRPHIRYLPATQCIHELACIVVFDIALAIAVADQLITF
jgi:hypothetical protein